MSFLHLIYYSRACNEKASLNRLNEDRDGRCSFPAVHACTETAGVHSGAGAGHHWYVDEHIYVLGVLCMHGDMRGYGCSRVSS